MFLGIEVSSSHLSYPLPIILPPVNSTISQSETPILVINSMLHMSLHLAKKIYV